MSVRTWGSGPHRVLFAHGWLGTCEDYARVLDALDPGEFTVALVDARGYGDRRDTAGAFTLAEVGSDLVAAADALGWGRFSLVGHSMGGLAIQHALLSAPARIRALVGISPVPASGSRLDGERLQLFRDAVDSTQSRRRLFDVSTGGRHDDEWLDARVRSSVRATDAVACRSYLDDWTTADISASIAGLDVPVLVVVGAHDPAVTAERSAATWGQWYRDVTIEEVQDAGHYAMLETPDRLARSIEEFLRSRTTDAAIDG